MREKITVCHQRYDFINSLQPSSGTKDKQKQMKIKLYKIRYQKTDRRIRLVMHYEKRIKSTYVINLHRCSQILLPHACSHTHIIQLPTTINVALSFQSFAKVRFPNKQTKNKKKFQFHKKHFLSLSVYSNILVIT